jgi:hypothetical protein
MLSRSAATLAPLDSGGNSLNLLGECTGRHLFFMVGLSALPIWLHHRLAMDAPIAQDLNGMTERIYPAIELTHFHMKQTSPDENMNSLFSINPKLSKEWHPTKNGSLKPPDLTPGSRELLLGYGRDARRI